MNDSLRAFWKRTRSELDNVPPDPLLTTAPSPDWINDEFCMQSVILHSIQNVLIRGWYLLPTDWPRRRRLPAVLIVPGYGGINMNPTAAHVAMNGYAVLILYPRAQGESKQDWDLPYGTKLTYGLPDREQYYYRSCYMDCIRGVDFLVSRSEVDPDRIGMWSASQGGGLTLATAALDNRLSAAIADLPFLCNMAVGVNLTTEPFNELCDYLLRYPNQRTQVLETLIAFDPLNLVDEITCPTLISVGMQDEVCPPSTILPVFERIQSLKSLIVYPELGHGMYIDFYLHALAWLRRYLSD